MGKKQFTPVCLVNAVPALSSEAARVKIVPVQRLGNGPGKGIIHSLVKRYG